MNISAATNVIHNTPIDARAMAAVVTVVKSEKPDIILCMLPYQKTPFYGMCAIYICSKHLLSLVALVSTLIFSDCITHAPHHFITLSGGVSFSIHLETNKINDVRRCSEA
jgi:hypothetical protein